MSWLAISSSLLILARELGSSSERASVLVAVAGIRTPSNSSVCPRMNTNNSCKFVSICGRLRRFGFGAGDFLEQAIDHLVAGHSGGFGAEGGENAVPQYGVRHLYDVFGGHVDAALEDGAGFAGEDQVDAGARAGAPLHQ